MEDYGVNFELTEQQETIREAISRICSQFGDDYWLARDQDGQFPDEFVKAITEGGWLGIAMPEAYGGAGLGITETTIMAHTIARSGAGMSGASAVHLNLFGPNPASLASEWCHHHQHWKKKTRPYFSTTIVRWRVLTETKTAQSRLRKKDSFFSWFCWY